MDDGGWLGAVCGHVVVCGADGGGEEEDGEGEEDAVNFLRGLTRNGGGKWWRAKCGNIYPKICCEPPSVASWIRK